MSSGSDRFDEYLDSVLIGGREPALVTIVDYDPAWPSRFAFERERIAAALGATAVGIEHIGSTSVPGLAAKPIVDIMVTVADVEDELRYGSPLEAAGYVARVREPGHRMYRTPACDVHLHVWPASGEEQHRHLAFRDWLRQNARDRMLYERTKRELAQRSYTDMNYYADAKSAVIADITSRAAAAAAPNARA